MSYLVLLPPLLILFNTITQFNTIKQLKNDVQVQIFTLIFQEQKSKWVQLNILDQV